MKTKYQFRWIISLPWTLACLHCFRVPQMLSVTSSPTLMICTFIQYKLLNGGFDKPDIGELLKDGLADDDHDILQTDNLLTTPPGFSIGGNFKRKNCDWLTTDQSAASLSLNSLKELFEDDDTGIFSLAKKTKVDGDGEVFKETEADVSSEGLKRLTSEVIVLSHIHEAISSSHSSYNNQSSSRNNYDDDGEDVAGKFVNVVDVQKPVKNFRKLLPVMALNFEFELDSFQKQAILLMERKQNVFVAAHTSAGKTVVAEYAIALSLNHMTKVIYTSPIKALSNQKFRDFKNKFGDVGLVTGDVQIAPEANVLVMTTEILRSMLYNGSDVIRDLEWVIFDEVHYINDADRGVVWEEVLILLPEHVKIAMLSATVPNTKEFAEWEDEEEDGERDKHNKAASAPGALYLHRHQPENFQGEQQIWLSLIHELERQSKLPAVSFVFSKKRINENADRLTSLDLLDSSERSKVVVFFNKCLQMLKPPDRELPQVRSLRDLLVRGIGVHHSGILPILKEIVEMLFQRGLVKVNTFRWLEELEEEDWIRQSKLTSSSFSSKTLVVGRLVAVSKIGDCDDVIGVLLSTASGIGSGKHYKVLVNCDSKLNNTLPADDSKDIKPKHYVGLRPYLPTGSISARIFELSANRFSAIFRNCLKVNADKIIEDVRKRDMPRFKDDLPSPSTQQASQELMKIAKDIYAGDNGKNPTPPALLDPVSDLHIHEVDVVELSQRYKFLEGFGSGEEFKCQESDLFVEKFREYRAEAKIDEEMKEIRYKLSDESLLFLPEYQQRVEVLRSLKCVDPRSNTIRLKGKVACEISHQELILTEVIFQNILSDFPPEVIAALLSCLVFEQKRCSEPNLNKVLNEAKEKFVRLAANLTEVQRQHGLLGVDVLEECNFGLMEVVYEWAKGVPFAKLMELTDVEEGVIVRCIQRLSETFRDLTKVSNIIGDPVLSKKVEEGLRMIKRDIVFAASLYVQ
ncbi:hypothetical protein HELRODRAFT_193051 [Helobdella robusta]|uniref:Helicase ATP-binding domain-containing protein n=1 Tax=Helobdella robusta TaxID=6412 RepID=T1FUK6_HELRO|nr:hypothetical protein HELRODRAFT_193051 [Helobdella robusta]ESN98332.1 hypothetical protein HELRODRAFT_193051 [Helobdella robusta]